jgi:hypothetical protein
MAGNERAALQPVRQSRTNGSTPEVDLLNGIRARFGVAVDSFSSMAIHGNYGYDQSWGGLLYPDESAHFGCESFVNSGNGDL